jgi:hypothetical protein
MNRVKPLVIRVLKVLVGVELAWLVLGNLFLNTALAPMAINFKPDKFSLQWDRAWTPYPARVHATGLIVNQHSWTTDVEIRADWATARIRLLPLLRRHLVVDRVRAGTASVTLNKKEPAGDRPAPSKSTPGLLIEIRDIDVKKVERFTFNEISVSGGEARVAGSASIRIRGEVKVEDIDAEWQDAKINLGEKSLADSLSVGFRGGIASFNPRKEKGLAMLAKLTADLDINGAVGSLVPLKLLFPEVDWIERIDGEGEVAIHMGIEAGKLQPGSVIDIAASGLELDFLGFRAKGAGRVDASVSDAGEGRMGAVSVVFDQFELLRSGSGETLALGRGLRLDTKASDLGLVRGLHGLEVVLDIPDSEVPDLSALAGRLPPGLGIIVRGGSARLQGHLEVIGAEEEATGSIQVLGEDLQGSFRNMEFEMDLEISSRLSGRNLDDFRVDLEGTEFRLFNGVFDNEIVEVDDAWWMTIAVPEGYANLAEPLQMEADVEMSMRDTRAIVALFAEVKDWIKYFDGILTIRDVEGTAGVAISDRKLKISELALHGDRLEFMAELNVEDGQNAGIIWGKLGIFSLGMERIGEETEWKMINGREWYEERKAENWVTGTPN